MEENDLWAALLRLSREAEKLDATLSAVRHQRDAEVARIHALGMPAAQIARRIGLSRPTIHKILKQQNAKE